MALQPEQLGTADAVRVGLAALGTFEGAVLVLSGDVPLLRRETVERLLALPGRVAMTSALAAEPTGYGRVLRGADGRVTRIVEERDAQPAECAVHEINAGLYRFDAQFLRENLARVNARNAQRELYLTDLIELAAREAGLGVLCVELAEVAGINDRRELAAAGAALRARVNAEHLRAGVTSRRRSGDYLHRPRRGARDRCHHRAGLLAPRQDAGGEWEHGARALGPRGRTGG